MKSLSIFNDDGSESIELTNILLIEKLLLAGLYLLRSNEIYPLLVPKIFFSLSRDDMFSNTRNN